MSHQSHHPSYLFFSFSAVILEGVATAAAITRAVPRWLVNPSTRLGERRTPVGVPLGAGSRGALRARQGAWLEWAGRSLEAS